MKLKMLIAFSGTHDGEEWPPIGGIVDISHEAEAANMVRLGYAEPVKDKLAPKPVVETAEKAPAENTAKRTAKPALRKGGRR
jgi:hypothetical protein